MDIFLYISGYIVHNLIPTWSDLGVVKCGGHEPSISLTHIPVFLHSLFKLIWKEIHLINSFRVKN